MPFLFIWPAQVQCNLLILRRNYVKSYLFFPSQLHVMANLFDFGLQGTGIPLAVVRHVDGWVMLLDKFHYYLRRDRHVGGGYYDVVNCQGGQIDYTACRQDK